MSVRHDWYQSETTVVVVIFLKNALDKECHVNISREIITVSAQDYEFYAKLHSPIKVDESVYRIFPTKIEITLVKEIDGHWRSLKLDDSAHVSGEEAPFSISGNKWEKICEETEDTEKKDIKGEEAIHNFFKSVYNSATPEARKAMNKSYIESAGTVLSTNWAVVSQGQVEIQPPTGMEYKEF